MKPTFLQTLNIRIRSALHSALTLMLLFFLSGSAWAIDTVWVEDALPSGAAIGGDSESWNWTSTSPTPYSGSLAHQSNLVSGEHQHYFYGVAPFSISASDTLFAYVYLDPTTPPTEIMLQWHDTASGWEHRAYWGGNTIPFGTDGTTSRKYIGPLPAAGSWVRLNVPASAVGLGGISIDGMAFTLWNGKATWDQAGKSSAAPALAISTTTLANGTTGAAYNQTLSASGGTPPYSWSITTGSLPAGLTLNPSTGSISGTPTTAGTSNFTVKVQDSSSSSTTRALSLTVNAAAGSNVYYIYADHLNTPRVITNTANTPVWKWDSDPFGTDVPNQNPAGLGIFIFNLRFPGQYFDQETGLHYNYFRDYDPSTGRYVQSDLIGLLGGINTYAYAHNNPLIYFDFDGKEATFAFSGGAVSSGGTASGVGSRAVGAFGPVGAVVGAGVGGFEIGTLIYPYIEPTLSKAIDACVPSDLPTPEECDAEWRRARNVCFEWFDEQGRPSTSDRRRRALGNLTGGSMAICMSGQVSEACGGTKVEQPPKRRRRKYL